MFVVAYRWTPKPGREEQFRLAWRRGTELIREKYGSLGSRLHRDEEGNFVGIAEWPDRATWERAFKNRMEYDEPETRKAFLDALEDAEGDPLLRLELTDDLLGATR